MDEPIDELDELREFFASPEPPSEVVVQRHKEMLMNHIESSGDHPTDVPTIDEAPLVHTAVRRRSRSRSRRVIAMVAIPVVAVALAAAGWAMTRTDATQAYAYACAADGNVTVMPNYGGSPIQECADEWARGAIEPGVTEAPPLVACVTDANPSWWDSDSKVVMVIEGTGDEACARAGMAPWAEQAEFEQAGEAVRSVLISFHDRFKATGNGCATFDDWTDGLAEQSGTRGWDLKQSKTSASNRCYDIDSIDPTTRTISLIAPDGDFSIGCDPRTGC